MEGGSFHIGAPPTLPVSKPTIPVSDLKQINLDIIRRRLSERLEEMTSVHRAHLAERDDVTSRVSDSHSQVHDGGGRSEELEDNYKFFQEMRAYVTDLVECLNEKVRASQPNRCYPAQCQHVFTLQVPKIDYLEASMLKLWQQRAQKLSERRKLDMQDEAADCAASVGLYCTLHSHWSRLFLCHDSCTYFVCAFNL